MQKIFRLQITGASIMMRWQCYVVTTMGYELVQDDFPMRFDRNAVTKAFEGRYGMKVIQVNPIGQN